MSAPQLWVAFDCESTGFPPGGRLIEIAAVSFFSDGTEPVTPFHRLVRPPVPIPTEITELTGLTDGIVADADPAPVVISAFRQWLPRDAVAVAHNLCFDLAILATEDSGFARSLRQQSIDSLTIARALGEFPNHRLATIAGCLARVEADSHRARTVKLLMLHALRRRLHEAWPDLFVPGGWDGNYTGQTRRLADIREPYRA